MHTILDMTVRCHQLNFFSILKIILILLPLLVLSYLSVVKVYHMLHSYQWNYSNYIKNLTAHYRTHEIPEYFWLPTDMDKFVNLALRHYDKSNFDTLFTPFFQTVHSDMDFEKFLEVVSDKPLKVLIAGDSGIGKTTFLNMIANKWAKGEILHNCEIVLLVDLSELTVLEYQVDTRTVLSIANMSVTQDMVNFTNDRGGKGLCFLLDGLDDYVDIYANKSSFVHGLLEGSVLQQSSVIVTSKPKVIPLVKHLTPVHLELLGFDEQHIQQYIQEKFRNDPTHIKKFSEYLDKHQSIKELCHVPLNLAMLVFIYDKRQTMFSSYGLPTDHQIDLPQTETEMYEKLVLLSLIGDWCKYSDGKCKVNDTLGTLDALLDLDPPGMVEVVYHIANLSYNGFLDRKNVFRIEELEPVLHTVKSSLLIVTRQNMFASQLYRLRHPQIKQFLAAYFFHSWLPIPFRKNLMEALHEGCHSSNYFEWEHCTDLLTNDFWKYTCGLLRAREDFPNYFEILSSVKHCKAPEASLLLGPHQYQHVYFKIVYDCVYEAQSEEGVSALLDYTSGSLSLTVKSTYDAVSVGYFLLQTAHNVHSVEFTGSTALDVLFRIICDSDITFIKLEDLRFRISLPVDFTCLLKKAPLLNSIEFFAPFHSPFVIWRPASVEKLPPIQRLVFHMFGHTNATQDKGIVDLIHGLASSLSLKALSLVSVHMQDSEVANLVSLIGNCSSLTHLSLSTNELTDTGMRKLADLLSMLPSLKALALSSLNAVTGEGAASVIRAAASHPTLAAIDLRDNKDIGNISPNVFFDALKDLFQLQSKNTTLQILLEGIHFYYIDKSLLPFRCWPTFPSWYAFVKSIWFLQYMCYSQFCIYPSTVSFPDACSHIISLDSLTWLTNDSEISGLLTVVGDCNSLTKLSLRGSNLTDAGMRVLAELLPKLPSLKFLDLSSLSTVTGEGAASVIRAAASHPELENIDFTANRHIGEENQDILVDELLCIENRPNVLDIYMYDVELKYIDNLLYKRTQIFSCYTGSFLSNNINICYPHFCVYPSTKTFPRL